MNLLPWALGLLSSAFLILIGYLHTRQNSLERRTSEDVKDLWKANNEQNRILLDFATNTVKRDDMNEAVRDIKTELRAGIAELRRHG